MVDIDQEIIRDTRINATLRNLFDEAHCTLKNINAEDLPDYFVRDFVKQLLSTCIYKSDWKDYAYKFQTDYEIPNKGDVDFIDEICSSVKTSNEGVQKSFVDVINTLQDLKRFDVLREISESPYVKSLVSTTETECNDSGVCLPDTSETCIKINENFISNKPKISDNRLQISVFIPHTTDALKTANRLCKILNSISNFSAVALYQIKSPSQKNLLQELHKADFILPIVNSTYLNVVRPLTCGQTETAFTKTDESINRFIFLQLQSKYLETRSNEHVIALLDPELKIREAEKGCRGVLFFFYRLFEDVEDMKLVEDLNKRKMNMLN